MTGQVVTQVKEYVDGLFPLKSFCLSLALLLILFLLSIGIFQIFMAEPIVAPQLTGKTIVVFEMPKQIVDQPIQTPVETPITAPVENNTLPADAHIDPDANLETAPAPATSNEHQTPAEHTTSYEIEDSVAGLSESTPLGFLPIIRVSDNLKSFDAYKAPFKPKPTTKSVISLVMVDYGLSDKFTQSALTTLPPMTSFVASPYAQNLQTKISEARSKGMEIWLGIPMQGSINSNPSNMGPNALLSGLNAKENLIRLNTHLGKATGYTGVAIDVKPTFSEDSKDLQALITKISLRGLGIAQLDPTDTLIETAVSHTTAPFAHGDMWIDSILLKDKVLRALADIEKKSLNDGQAIAVFRPSPLLYSVISEWQKGLDAQKIQLAPLTYSIHISGRSSVGGASVPKETPSHEQQH